jgi:ABC-2 type transport system permease protein
MMEILLREIRGHFLAMLRAPMFAIPTLMFPTMFYIFFGLTFPQGGGSVHLPTWLLATYGTFGIMGPALFGFGVGIAVEKGEGWLRLKRAAPVSPFVPLLARAAMAMLFAFIVFAILASLGALFGEVRMYRADWVALAATLTLGAIPFCALGLAAGLWLSPQAAPAVMNLIYLPLSFLSGLWIPLMLFPEWMQRMALALPPYHLASIALDIVGGQASKGIALHVAVLGGFTLLFLAVAAVGWRRYEES